MPKTRFALTVFFIGGACFGTLFLLLFSGQKFAFGQATTTTSSITISVEVPATSTPGGFPTSGDGGTTITLPGPGQAAIIFSGFAYPDAIVTFSRNGGLAGNTATEPDGTFEKTIQANSGISAFSVSARDTAMLNSPTQNFSLNIVPGTTVRVSNLLLSPTIQSSATSVARGEAMLFSGSAYPASVVQMVVDDMLADTVLPRESGKWQFNLKTKTLSLGKHVAFARSFIRSSGLFSPPSDVLPFTLGTSACNSSDLNNDGVVNIADLSILLFYWKQANPKNQCADLSGDSIVDVADLSILMYAWHK